MSSALQPGYRIERVLDAPLGGPQFGLVRAFIKYHSADNFEIANEYICARLAHSIGLPCPPGDFAHDSNRGTLAWISPLAMRTSPPPVDPVDIETEAPEVCAGILVFDSWVLNLDRHDWNIIHSPSYGTWAIDHGQALFFAGSDPAGALDAVRDQRMTGSHLLAGHADPSEVGWYCTKISSLGENVIDDAIRPVQRHGLIGSPHARALRDFLSHRAAKIESLLPSGTLPQEAP